MGVLHGLGFSKKGEEMKRPAAPTVKIAVNGEDVQLPCAPARMTNRNGYTGYDIYEAQYTLPSEAGGKAKLTATSNNPEVTISISQPEGKEKRAP